MTIAFWSILTASLIGSAHCAGMCGPLAILALGRDRSAAGSLAYHGARLAGYVVLGAVAGAVGAGLDRAGAFAHVTGAAALVAGVVMLLWGGATLLAWSGVRLPRPRWQPSSGLWTALAARVRGQPPLGRAAGLGMMSALLPCGWLYVYVAMAAGTGHPVPAMGVMAVFWVGTVPALAAIGLTAHRLAGPLRRWLPLATGTILVLAGLVTIVMRGMPTVSSAEGLHQLH